MSKTIKYEQYSKEWADARDNKRKDRNMKAREKTRIKREEKAKRPWEIVKARVKADSKIRSKVRRDAKKEALRMSHCESDKYYIAEYIMDYICYKVAKHKGNVDDDYALGYWFDKAVIEYGEELEARYYKGDELERICYKGEERKPL